MTQAQLAAKERLNAIDILRGAVIVLMALDHARDFFGMAPHAPEDLSKASAALFLTRWVTHFCAPVFVFLAGTSAFLYQTKNRTKTDLTKFLVSRGIWLVLIELIVVNLSWFQIGYNSFIFLQVIWVLGVSMIALAGFIWLPRWLTLTVAILMIVGHNALDGIQPKDMGDWAVPWAILHAQYGFKIAEGTWMIVVYPLIPWIGVMALGYLLGPVFFQAADKRRKTLLLIGLGAVAAFILLRLINIYGDPKPWEVGERGAVFALLSFFNTTKYPASLAFLLMTLGPALISLSILERFSGRISGFFQNFGRVPMFFYLIHVPFMHLAAILLYSLLYSTTGGWWLQSSKSWPPEYSHQLWWAYAGWIIAVACLYPLCRWFAALKRRRRDWWLSYL